MFEQTVAKKLKETEEKPRSETTKHKLGSQVIKSSDLSSVNIEGLKENSKVRIMD